MSVCSQMLFLNNVYRCVCVCVWARGGTACEAVRFFFPARDVIQSGAL